MRKLKHILIIIFVLALEFSNAQEAQSVSAPRVTTRFNCGIPKVTSSQLFRNSFTGVVFADANVNVKLFSNVFVGVGYTYSFLKTTPALSNMGVFTTMESQQGYLKLGYDHYLSNNQFVSFSLNSGYGISQYKKINYPNDSLIGRVPTQFNSPFIEPQVGFYLLNDDGIALGINLGYNFNLYKYDSRAPVIDKWLTNNDKLSNKWNMSAIKLSLGIYYGFGK